MALVEQSAFRNPGFPLKDWHRRVYAQLDERLHQPSAFPCTFSQNAYRRELVQFSFVETFDKAGIDAFTSDILAYTTEARTWDGQVNTAKPLIVAFSLKVAQFDTLEAYHAFGWSALQKLHENDPEDWPADVSHNPHEPFWSMCFDRMQLFVNMSAPLHKVRKSRNLGDHLLFIVNPRERFDIVAGNTPVGRNVRANIRRRVEAYDGVPHCHQLGSYQAGEIEWWQYGIIEENADRTDQCPFKFQKKTETI